MLKQYSCRGKNFARTFTHPKCSIKDRYPRSFDKVLALQDKHDPNKVFEPELWQHIRQHKPFDFYPRWVCCCCCCCYMSFFTIKQRKLISFYPR
jgi:hypothetical protein